MTKETTNQPFDSGRSNKFIGSADALETVPIPADNRWLSFLRDGETVIFNLTDGWWSESTETQALFAAKYPDPLQTFASSEALWMKVQETFGSSVELLYIKE